jgi:hypothetical protein
MGGGISIRRAINEMDYDDRRTLETPSIYDEKTDRVLERTINEENIPEILLNQMIDYDDERIAVRLLLHQGPSIKNEFEGTTSILEIEMLRCANGHQLPRLYFNGDRVEKLLQQQQSAFTSIQNGHEVFSSWMLSKVSLEKRRPKITERNDWVDEEKELILAMKCTDDMVRSNSIIDMDVLDLKSEILRNASCMLKFSRKYAR